jgi:hypothetical protein
MPLQQTSGNVTADAYGGGVAAVPVYIEDVFSVFAYAGDNGTNRAINNGIDLSTKGGMVWEKLRNTSYDHAIFDTARGATNYILSNNSSAQTTQSNSLTSFTTTGYTLGSATSGNSSGYNYVSWTFRKQPKFFDVVTWTGDGSGSRYIPHSLNSVPGCIIVKKTDAGGVSDWYVYHRSLNTPNASNPELNALVLNSSAGGVDTSAWYYTPPTSTQFRVSGPAFNVFDATYVAYVYAHNAGGFGLTGTDNVISCGRFTINSSGGITVSLGYEPQYLLIKRIDSAGGPWQVTDTMRGWSQTNGFVLQPNVADAEYNYWGTYCQPTETGFVIKNGALTASVPYIYIAIRKGPMKVPTDATKVFSPIAYTGNGGTQNLTTNFPVDFTINISRDRGWNSNSYALSRLVGNGYSMNTNNNSSEASGLELSFTGSSPSTGIALTGVSLNGNGYPFIEWNFRRAPSFFDAVCYTGDGVDGRTVNHNLTVAPELLIVKARSSATNWTGNYWPLGVNRYIYLNSANGASGSNGALRWASTAPTATDFTLGTIAETNASGVTFVAYLFASCTGVSKLGAYTGTGASITIDCGFPSGARFVMIKRTDIGSTTGDWYVYDTSRGMVAGNDRILALNNTNAETNSNSVYTVATGFQILASPTPDINTSGATYFYLAIA